MSDDTQRVDHYRYVIEGARHRPDGVHEWLQMALKSTPLHSDDLLVMAQGIGKHYCLRVVNDGRVVATWFDETCPNTAAHATVAQHPRSCDGEE